MSVLFGSNLYLQTAAIFQSSLLQSWPIRTVTYPETLTDINFSRALHALEPAINSASGKR